MAKLLKLLALLTCIAACTQVNAPTKPRFLVAPGDEKYLVGTWLELNNPSHKEVFLSSNKYCRYEGTKRPKVVAVGSWSNLVYLHITDSLNSNEISLYPNEVEILEITPINQNKLAMGLGYSCPDCGYSIGTIYIRASQPIMSCDKVARSDP